MDGRQSLCAYELTLGPTCRTDLAEIALVAIRERVSNWSKIGRRPDLSGWGDDIEWPLMHSAKRKRSHLRKLSALGMGCVGCLLLMMVRVAPARADAPDWASLLPGLTDAFAPTSTNDCVAGRPTCVAAVITEMRRRFETLGRSCHHDAPFALLYLRTTQTFQWATLQPGFFADVAWMNHYDAVFAKYYFRAYDDYAAGLRTSVPEAWLVAFDASVNREVTGAGSLLLGVSAHVRRDLPFVLAGIGLTAADGTSRKPDHDQVNEFLSLGGPALVEAAARFDSGIINVKTSYGTGHLGLLRALTAWREQAWHYAELLVNAQTEQARIQVAQQIETTAGNQARAIMQANSYRPPFPSSADRDAYCAVNNEAAPPYPYVFGMPTPY